MPFQSLPFLHQTNLISVACYVPPDKQNNAPISVTAYLTRAQGALDDQEIPQSRTYGFTEQMKGGRLFGVGWYNRSSLTSRYTPGDNLVIEMKYEGDFQPMWAVVNIVFALKACHLIPDLQYILTGKVS